jgi:hypothetical protein
MQIRTRLTKITSSEPFEITAGFLIMACFAYMLGAPIVRAIANEHRIDRDCATLIERQVEPSDLAAAGCRPDTIRPLLLERTAPRSR